MRVLVIGSGGREHALARALAQSASVDHVVAAPGNPGTASIGENVACAADDADGLLGVVEEHAIDLTIVGPEQPLVAGVVDRFEEAGHPTVGPTAAAARLEGSKAFAKDFMQRYDIPTARFRTFPSDDYTEASAYLDEAGAPIVVKASGLAGGKGAIVCDTVAEAQDALERIVQDRDFGAAGDRVVIEEFMDGEEVSVFALTDGANYVLLAPSQDHKQIGEGDTGPNTGGMGAYAPAPILTGQQLTEVCRTIIEPTLTGMAEEGTPYRGVLYCGLMVTSDGPKVVEFNCRLGDPEAQVVLPLIDSDLGEVFHALAHDALDTIALRGTAQSAACVVLASKGYPIEYDTGFPITGLDVAEALEGVTVIHAGTKQEEDGTIVTDGGRVLNVVATADSLEAALDRAYAGAERIQFEGKTFRRDIGQKGLAHLTS
jgi:phosphoribosylamine--glycine ligase